MEKVAFLFIVCAQPYVWPVPTGSEMVWLKDVTSRFQTHKRKVGDSDLPDDLTFYLSRGPHILNLNLKRNHGINPNADIYFVRTLQDGRTHLEKTQSSEKEDVAYYQDRENGAFMTVRCVKRSKGQCEKVIHGNIRIGAVNYNIQPAETDITSRNVLDGPGLLGTLYVLQDQANIQREISVEKKDAEYVNERNVEKGLMDVIRRFPHGQDNQSLFRNFTIPSINNAGLHNREAKDKRNKQVYYVEITVITDSGIWDLYSSQVKMPDGSKKDFQVKRRIRQAFSQFINGTKSEFMHRSSNVKEYDGKTYIDANNYIKDVAAWDVEYGSKSAEEYDHVMLFTRHDLYDKIPTQNNVKGISYPSGVCDKGRRVSVVEAFAIFSTVSTAAHELGHNLGADHDGEDDAKSCDPNDLYIMSPNETRFSRDKPHSRNPWMFSNCSIEAFKKTLKDKNCLNNKGIVFDEDQWNLFVMKSPGEPESADICLYMQCKDPIKKTCLPRHHIAARGTKCGENMWCQEGMCVPKLRNRS